MPATNILPGPHVCLLECSRHSRNLHRSRGFCEQPICIHTTEPVAFLVPCDISTASTAGSPELYAVPRHSDVTSITLKLWGAGGGGVLTPAAAGILAENDTSNATQGTPTLEMIPQQQDIEEPAKLEDTCAILVYHRHKASGMY